MSLFGKKKKAQDTGQEYRTKDFFDCILPGSIKFFANYYIVGDTYRCVWVISSRRFCRWWMNRKLP